MGLLLCVICFFCEGGDVVKVYVNECCVKILLF